MNTTVLKFTADVDRMVADGHSTVRQRVLTGIPCMLIPSDTQTATSAGLEVSRAFDIFFDGGAGVKVSDKVTINGVAYYLKGVREFSNVGIASHIQCIAEIADAKA